MSKLTAFATVYAAIVIALVVANLSWCEKFGKCWIDDPRHTHKEKK